MVILYRINFIAVVTPYRKQADIIIVILIIFSSDILIQITEKLRINQAKLQLTFNQKLDLSPIEHAHACNDCNFSLDEEASEVFDELPNMESSVDDDVKSNLVHIAGYVVRKVDSTDEDTHDYYEKYGAYTERLNRGGLKARL